MNVKPISTYEMTRIEDMDADNPQLVVFKQEGTFRANYENYEIAHFRLLEIQIIYHTEKVWWRHQSFLEATPTYGRCYAHS